MVFSLKNIFLFKINQNKSNSTKFRGSSDYWNNRYLSGRNSGDGSYSHLAAFKAEVINSFVKKNSIRTVIEFGSGDGNQLSLASYPKYSGFDVSQSAIDACRELFSDDSTKQFHIADDYDGEKADLVLSLDVVFHLVEDNVFELYMSNLFRAALGYVIVYSSNTNANEPDQPPHVKHRMFSSWIDANQPGWKLVQKIENMYPFEGDSKVGSFSDFYIYKKSH